MVLGFYFSMLHPISRQSPFRIERTTGLITLQSSSTINPGIFTVTIAATDDGIPQLTLRQNVSIYVTNVNERPTNIIMRNNKVGHCPCKRLFFLFKKTHLLNLIFLHLDSRKRTLRKRGRFLACRRS